VSPSAEQTRGVPELDVVTEVLRTFGIENAKVTPLDIHGSTAVSAVVCADGTELMLKRTPAVQSDLLATQARLIEQAELTGQLGRHGVPVAVPMPARDGQPVVSGGDSVFTLTPRLMRRTPGLPTRPEIWPLVGRQLATLHIALEECVATAQGWTMDLPRQLGEEIWPALDVASGEIGLLMPRLVDRLDLADRIRGLPTQRLHGDLHGGNILLDGEGIYAVVDFDEIPIGPRVSDIGYYAADLVKNRVALAGDIVAIIGSVVTGYCSLAVLSRREADALVPWMIVSELRLLWWLLPRTSDGAGQIGAHLDTLGWILDHRAELDAVVGSATASADRRP
jgi:Ser/Thr protein kinase RdoA (MazF antagonist)